MTDRLKDFIDNNLDNFNDLDVPEGNWDAISYKMGHKPNKSKLIIRYSSFAVAALVAGLVFLVVPFRSANNNMTNNSQIPELAEAQAYYTLKVNQKRDEVYRLTNNQPELKQEMEIDLAELDSIMLELKNDLKDNVSNAEVIEAMIQNYRMKLMILEDIRSYLEQQNSKTDNTTSYEL